MLPKMTEDEMIEIIQAYKDGKKIGFKVRETGKDSRRIYSPSWNFDYYTYYIIPEPKYEPYTAEDLDKMSADDRVVRFKGDRYPILEWNERVIRIGQPLQVFTYKYLLENCTHIDEKKPFGKLVK